MTEKEYIERGSLLEWVREFYPEEKVFASAIINAPAADVQEVVKCKDCVNSRNLTDTICVCKVLGKVMISEDYCSYGAKMDEE